MSFLERQNVLFDTNKLNKILSQKVLIVGLGGVGGCCLEMLVRCGIENLVLVDGDKFEESNLNRQILATTKTIGKFKTEVAKTRVLEINPSAHVEIFSERLNKNNLAKIVKSGVFVVDAIDSVEDKVDLICFCKENNIQIVSSMGAGNRSFKTNFSLLDISKTCYDPLAKAMRKKLKLRGVEHLNVVCDITQSEIEKSEKIGSVSFAVSQCGIKLAESVIKLIIGDE